MSPDQARRQTALAPEWLAALEEVWQAAKNRQAAVDLLRAAATHDEVRRGCQQYRAADHELEAALARVRAVEGPSPSGSIRRADPDHDG